jgi:AcrR family transcriptional regulator
MELIVGAVKPRRYDASRRQAQARLSREAILEVARDRFLQDGFAASTISSIATDAGVSTDTIYKTFGGKPGLVRALCEEALAGTGPVPAERRSDEMQAAESDPATLLRGLGTLTAEVAPRIAPLLLVLATAADTDPAMAQLQADLESARLARMAKVARTLARKTRLRSGMSTREAAEILWTYSSPQLFGLLVLTRRWSAERFGAFVGDALVAALLPAADASRGAVVPT